MGSDAPGSMESLADAVHQLELPVRIVGCRAHLGTRSGCVVVGELAGSAAGEQCSRVGVDSSVGKVEDPAGRGEDDAVGKV